MTWRRVVHFCHWPDCREIVAPRLWGCAHHWRQLPFQLRRDILATYVPGQEVRKDPSPAYLAAARAADTWARTRHPFTTEAARPFSEPVERESNHG